MISENIVKIKFKKKINQSWKIITKMDSSFHVLWMRIYMSQIGKKATIIQKVKVILQYDTKILKYYHLVLNVSNHLLKDKYN